MLIDCKVAALLPILYLSPGLYWQTLKGLRNAVCAREVYSLLCMQLVLLSYVVY